MESLNIHKSRENSFMNSYVPTTDGPVQPLSAPGQSCLQPYSLSSLKITDSNSRRPMTSPVNILGHL